MTSASVEDRRRKRCRRLQVLLARRPLQVGCRFLQDQRGPTYFALAEVECRKTDLHCPCGAVSVLARHVLLLAPRNDPLHVEAAIGSGARRNLLADVREKGEAA